MTLAWTPWLPENAVLPAAVQRMLADQIGNWSGDWFAGAPAYAVGQFSRVTAPRSELRKTIWHDSGEGVAIGLPATGAAALGALVIDVSTAPGNRSAEDIELLGSLGKDCLDDLKHRLGQLFALSKPDWRQSEAGQGAGPAQRLEISLAARALTIQVELTESRFARFLRTMLPASAPTGPLADGADALAGIAVSLSALLGRCSLNLAELSGLAVEDVLVLDSGTADSLPLAVDGALLARGRCAAVEAEAGLALKIIQAPTR